MKNIFFHFKALRDLLKKLWRTHLYFTFPQLHPKSLATMSDCTDTTYSTTNLPFTHVTKPVEKF